MTFKVGDLVRARIEGDLYVGRVQSLAPHLDALTFFDRDCCASFYVPRSDVEHYDPDILARPVRRFFAFIAMAAATHEAVRLAVADQDPCRLDRLRMMTLDRRLATGLHHLEGETSNADEIWACGALERPGDRWAEYREDATCIDCLEATDDPDAFPAAWHRRER